MDKQRRKPEIAAGHYRGPRNDYSQSPHIPPIVIARKGVFCPDVAISVIRRLHASPHRHCEEPVFWATKQSLVPKVYWETQKRDCHACCRRLAMTSRESIGAGSREIATGHYRGPRNEERRKGLPMKKKETHNNEGERAINDDNTGTIDCKELPGAFLLRAKGRTVKVIELNMLLTVYNKGIRM